VEPIWLSFSDIGADTLPIDQRVCSNLRNLGLDRARKNGRPSVVS
jgi:hypothetical protein